MSTAISRLASFHRTDPPLELVFVVCYHIFVGFCWLVLEIDCLTWMSPRMFLSPEDHRPDVPDLVEMCCWWKSPGCWSLFGENPQGSADKALQNHHRI